MPALATDLYKQRYIELTMEIENYLSTIRDAYNNNPK
jgi:hypothetical protein